MDGINIRPWRQTVSTREGYHKEKEKQMREKLKGFGLENEEERRERQKGEKRFLRDE